MAKRWWMWQPITDTLQFATASSEKEDVPFTLLLHTRYFQGCHLTKWQKRGCAAWNNQAAQVIPQLQHERDSRFHEIDGMGQVPRSVWRWKKEHLLVTTVSKKVAASIRIGNCKDNIQAVEVDNFMKSTHPHWISSSANNIVGPSWDIVLSSMTLQQVCRQEKAPNSELNLTHVEMSGNALTKPLTDPASTSTMCNAIQNDIVAAQPSVQTKENGN